MKNFTQIALVVLAVIIFGCLIFGCRTGMNMEFLENKVPTGDISEITRGANMIKKEDDDDDELDLSEGSPAQNYQQAAMDLQKNVPVPEGFSNYY